MEEKIKNSECLSLNKKCPLLHSICEVGKHKKTQTIETAMNITRISLYYTGGLCFF